MVPQKVEDHGTRKSESCRLSEMLHAYRLHCPKRMFPTAINTKYFRIVSFCRQISHMLQNLTRNFNWRQTPI